MTLRLEWCVPLVKRKSTLSSTSHHGVDRYKWWLFYIRGRRLFQILDHRALMPQNNSKLSFWSVSNDFFCFLCAFAGTLVVWPENQVDFVQRTPFMVASHADDTPCGHRRRRFSSFGLRGNITPSNVTEDDNENNSSRIAIVQLFPVCCQRLIVRQVILESISKCESMLFLWHLLLLGDRMLETEFYRVKNRRASCIYFIFLVIE